jgi:hypothetical protein
MKSELLIIISIGSFIGTVILCTCFKIYKNNMKIQNEKNRLNSIHKKLTRKKMITPIADDDEVKDENYNDITTVEIRTAEHFVLNLV